MDLKFFFRYASAAFACCVSVALVSCAGDSNPSITDESLESGDTTPTQTSKTIGPEGGELVSEDGKFRLEFPAGALSAPQAVTVTKRPISDLPAAITDNSQVTTLYMLEPEGITFGVPVTAILTISSAGSVSGDVIEVPERFLTLESQNLLSIANNQHATLDANTQILTLSGEIAHFSRIWDNLPRSGGVSVHFSGIPVSTAVGDSAFGASVSVTHPASSRVADSQTTLGDSSVAPVQSLELGAGENLGALVSGNEQTLSSTKSYSCSAAGEGTYAARIQFENLDLEPLVTAFGLNARASETQVVSYSSGVSRRILCTGSAGSGSNPDSDTETTVGLSLDRSAVSFDHTVGTTSCPQKIASITVENDGSSAADYSIDVNTASLDVQPETFQLEAGEQQEIALFFTCDQTTSFEGTITVTGTDGEDTVSKDVSVNGTVHN